MRYGFLCSVLMLLTACTPLRDQLQSKQRSGVVVLRLAETAGPSHPAAQTCDWFAARVKERTGGRIAIKVYGDGALGDAASVLTQVRFGGIAMARVSSLDLVEFVESLKYDFKPSSYANPDELMTWIQDDEEKIRAHCQMERLYPLVFLYPDIRCLYSDQTRVVTLEDLRGKKVGAAPNEVLQTALRALGAAPVDLTAADVYTSLRTGYMQIRESSLSDLASSDEYPFIRYVTLSRALAFPDLIVMSSEVMNDLSVADRSLIQKCAQESYRYHYDLLLGFRAQALEQLRADGKSVFDTPRFFAELNRALGRE